MIRLLSLKDVSVCVCVGGGGNEAFYVSIHFCNSRTYQISYVKDTSNMAIDYLGSSIIYLFSGIFKFRGYILLIFFFCLVEGWVQLGPLGMVATDWPIVACPGLLWWWIWCNEDWQGILKYSEKTCSSAILSTTNLTWPHPGLNPGRRSVKPATNCLSCGVAIYILLNDSIIVTTEMERMWKETDVSFMY
jgi:hypothetical protein